MADIINLRNARKQKQRDESAKAAANNREKFGRTKAEKLLVKAELLLAEESLDGHKRDE